ncbi:MAG: sugar phosphate isomerase/epimerase [Planctomycetes bacterium]|nr:sugar phosphate isomerase/epimerase [Planctomycetota bacterium]
MAAPRGLWSPPPQVNAFAPKIGLTRGPDQAKSLASMGADFIEIGCGLLMPGKSDEEFAGRRKQLKECELPIHGANGFLPGRMKSTGPRADHAVIAAYATDIFRRGEEVGMKTVTFGSSGSRSLPEGYPRADADLQFVALLSRLAPIAARYNIRICVEPLQKSETNYIQYVHEATRLIDAVQQPNVGITADIFHMLRGEESAESIRGAGEYIQHVHVAELAKRTAPGVDGDDFTPYFQALKDIGYAGPISMECRWDDLNKQFPVALETVRTQLGSLK